MPDGFAGQVRPERARAIANWLIVASVGLAACVAATLAHLGIDVAGDFVLSHDAYDGVAHGSRAMAAVVALSLLLACTAFALWAAIVDVRRDRAELRGRLASAFGRSPWRFTGAVVVATWFVLVAMETLDTVLQNGRLDDFTDLLGGSVALALAITVPTAAAVAFAFRRLLGTLLHSCRAFVVAVGSFLRRALHRFTLARFNGDRRQGASVAYRPCILSLQTSRRGPPHLSVRSFITA